jgi:hypothetical protein
MGFSRSGALLAAAGLLLVGACSGSNLVDDLGTPLPPDDDATVPAPPFDGASPPATEDGSPPPATDAERPNPKRDSSVPGPFDDAGAPDATSDDGSQVPESGTDDAAKTPDSGGSGSDASTTDDGSTFACGPTKRCDAATEYCRIVPSGVVTNIILPLDGGKLVGTSYTCVALPPCDAADPCTCLQGGILQPAIVGVGTSCSCSDHDGDITQSCSGGIQPQGS